MLSKTRNLLSCLGIGLLVCLPAPDLYGEQWNQFRGSDYGRTSASDVPVRWQSDNVAWKTALPGRGASSPSVFGDRVYLTAYTGYGIDKETPGNEGDLKRHLLCIRASDGEVIWSKTVPASSAENPFTVWAVSLHGYASSTAAVDDTGVYVFFGATGVLAFSHDGNELWRTRVGSGTHKFGAGSSPLLYKDMVIVNASVESGDLVALNKADGEVVWRHPGINSAWNTPVVYEALDGSDELAITIEDKVLGFNPNTGERLWSCAGIEDYICPSIVVHNGIVYAIGGRSSRTVAVRSGGQGDVTESRKTWDIGKGSNVSSPVYHDGHLYWANEKRGIVYCANAATGEVMYEERLEPSPGLIYASPLLADGRLYYVSRLEGIFVVAAKPQFQQLAHTQLEEDETPLNASPAVLADGSVLLRSDQYLYRLKPAGQ